MKKLYVFLVLLAPLFLALSVSAQQWSTEQQEVWKTIDAQWQADKDEERTITGLSSFKAKVLASVDRGPSGTTTITKSTFEAKPQQ